MKLLRVALLAALVLPGAAQAAPLSAFAAHELPLGGGGRSVESKHRFDLVGLHWRGPGSVLFRTHRVGGAWSAWHAAAPEPEDLPNSGTAEARRDAGWRIGNPWWAGSSDAIQVRTRGRVNRVREYFVSTTADSVPVRHASVAGSPPIITRAAWRADESIRREAPLYAPSLQLAIVHHTAGSNTYTRAQSAAIVRGIEIYHVQGNGWNDIGYNFLVDKYGQIFEGRYGGIERNVVGAHAEGFNTRSTGIALLGNYSSAAPTPAALAAIARLIAWRLDIGHVDPLTTTTYVSGGNARFPSGVPVFERTVSGHRDTGFTDCPGTKLYAKLASIAAQAQAIGLPKIYAPLVQGKAGAPVRFRATLSSPLPWSVTVLDSTGDAVAGTTGTGSAIDWTWDATGLLPTGRYTYEIAVAGARSATGVVGGGSTSSPAPATLTASPAAATLTPNGDGRGDALNVRWTLGAAAQVTVTAIDESGIPLITLLNQRKTAGSYVFTWRASIMPDGYYTLQFAAAGAGGFQAKAAVKVLVDRTLAATAASSHYLSPNADGKLDTIAFTFGLSAAAHVKLRIRSGTTELGSVFEGDLEPGPQRFGWNGTLAGVPLPDGPYQALVSATDPLATLTQGATFSIDTTPPVLQVVSGPQLRFRLNEKATVRLLVDGKRIVKAEPAGVFHVPYKGLATTVTATPTDPAGNVGAAVSYP